MERDLRQSIAEGRMSAYQWLVVALTVMLNILDGFDVLALAFTAKSIQGELGLSGIQIGSLMSAGLLGMAAGSFVLAPLADKFGRRPILLVSTLLSAVGMLMTYFAQSSESIALWRVVTGLGVGGILPCTNVIVSEYASRKWRGLAIAVYASGFGIGAMLGGMSAVFLQNDYGWRSVFLTGAMLTFIAFFILLVWLPESVDFLMSKRAVDAKPHLKRIAEKTGRSGEWDVLPDCSDAGKPSVSLLRLFDPACRRTTLLIWVAFIAIMASFYFVSSWTPSLLEAAGMSKQESQTVGIAISLGGTVGSLLFGFLVSRFAPKKTLVVFILLSAVAIGAFVSGNTLAVSLVLAVCIGGLVNGCITGLYTINPTLYDAGFRSTGVGTAIGIGRIGSILSPVVAGRLLDTGWAKNELYLATAFVLCIAAIAVILLKTPENQINRIHN